MKLWIVLISIKIVKISKYWDNDLIIFLIVYDFLLIRGQWDYCVVEEQDWKYDPSCEDGANVESLEEWVPVSRNNYVHNHEY